MFVLKATEDFYDFFKKWKLVWCTDEIRNLKEDNKSIKTKLNVVEEQLEKLIKKCGDKHE